MPRILRTVNQFSEENPAFTQSSLRWLIHNAASNGLDEIGAIVRIKRRVLVDVPLFFKWVDEQQKIVRN